jgi:hypothetical protein
MSSRDTPLSDSSETKLCRAGSDGSTGDVRASQPLDELSGLGLRTTTLLPLERATISATLASARMRPRPSTRMWSAVSAISLIRCDDRKIVRVLGVRTPVDRDGAVGGPVQAHEHAHGGRLAGAVRAEEAGDLARPDGEADAVDGGLRAVPLGEVLSSDHDDS